MSLGRIRPDGGVELVERRLVDKLTSTLGLDTLKVGTEQFPTGTAFVAEGANPITTVGGPSLEAEFYPRLLAVDALSKRAVIGEIPLGPDSVIGRKFEGLDHPNGVAADRAGNLYVGDIANGGLPGRLPAIYRIPHAAIDGLAAGDEAAGEFVTRIEMPGHVNGLCASILDDTIWAVSCSVTCPVGGGIYQIAPVDFRLSQLPAPRVRGLGRGILDGVGLTRRGTLLASTPRDGGLHAFLPDGDHRLITTEAGPAVSLAPDFNVCYPKALKGEPALIVPDLSMGKPPGGASVAVLDLSGY
jgi:hypothetical protein